VYTITSTGLEIDQAAVASGGQGLG